MCRTYQRTNRTNAPPPRRTEPAIAGCADRPITTTPASRDSFLDMPVEGGTGTAVVSPAASTLRDEMAVIGQRLLAASGQIPMAAQRSSAQGRAASSASRGGGAEGRGPRVERSERPWEGTASVTGPAPAGQRLEAVG